MATKPTSEPQARTLQGRANYERRDVSAPWIFGVVLFLIFAGVIIQWGLAGALKYLLKTPAPTDPWRRPPQATQSAAPGSFPRLQVSAALDLGEFRAREDEVLTNYGWIDRRAGIVRVPIARAMELVLQKGLPVGTNRPGLSPAQLIEKRAPEHSQPPAHP